MATFSVTDLGTFRRCRLRWDWSSKARRNLTTRSAGPEQLELGGLVHRALADWILLKESDRDKVVLSQIFILHASLRQKEIENSYKEKTGYKMPESALDSLHNVVKLGIAMMNNYQLQWKTPYPDNMKFAVPEQEVLVPVTGTEHQCPDCFNFKGAFGVIKYSGSYIVNPECQTCNGKGYTYHYLSATLDGLLQDDRDWFYVLEHKTYEHRPKQLDLEMNDQFTGYAWVVWQLVKARGGIVGGVAYDGMWKREKPPSRPKQLELKDLFIRKILPKPIEMLQQWEVGLTQQINEMANNPEIYPNVPWQGCGDCSFQVPCYMKMRGEDIDQYINLTYTQREIVRSGAIEHGVDA